MIDSPIVQEASVDAFDAGAPSVRTIRTERATVATVGGAVVSGLLFDGMVHNSVAAIAGTVFFIGASATLALLYRRTAGRVAQACFAAAALFGLMLAFRSSPWLLVFDLLCATLLLWAGAFAVRNGSPFALSASVVLDRSLRTFLHGVHAPAFVWKPIADAVLRGRGQRTRAVVRGVMLIAPVLVVLALLLGSADAVFASFFTVHFEPGSLTGHLVAIAIGAWLVAVLCRIAATRANDPHPSTSFRIGAIEALVALSCLVLLFVAFVASQVVVWAGGADHVLQTAGLTYADHARQGFFQLLAVAAITLLVLQSLRARTTLASPAFVKGFKLLALASTALTLVIVGVALRRLGLYEHVFGLTMLRLYSSVFALWIATVFVLLAASLLRHDAGRWHLSASVISGMVMLIVLNLANPEALVVDRNAHRNQSDSAVAFDAFYASRLSDDAVPALVASLDRMDAETRALVLSTLCPDSEAQASTEPKGGVLRWNWSQHEAQRARAAACAAG